MRKSKQNATENSRSTTDPTIQHPRKITTEDIYQYLEYLPKPLVDFATFYAEEIKTKWKKLKKLLHETGSYDLAQKYHPNDLNVLILADVNAEKRLLKQLYPDLIPKNNNSPHNMGNLPSVQDLWSDSDFLLNTEHPVVLFFMMEVVYYSFQQTFFQIQNKEFLECIAPLHYAIMEYKLREQRLFTEIRPFLPKEASL